MTINLDALYLDEWTAIAVKPSNVWIDIDDAPMNLETANDLYERKLILKAQRKTADGRWEVIIKLAKPPEPKTFKGAYKDGY